MFNGATEFNQDIGSWDVSKVFAFVSIATDTRCAIQMTSKINSCYFFLFSYHFYSKRFMFSGAISFNKDIGNWNPRNGLQFVSIAR